MSNVGVRRRDPKRQLEAEAGYLHLSNAIIYGLPWISAQALLTYEKIIGLDWTGRGNVYWSKSRLASICDLPWRTLQRHIQELAHYGLITREERENDTSILWIEELPDVAYELAAHRRQIITARASELWPGKEGFLGTFRRWAAEESPRSLAAIMQMEAKTTEWKAKKDSEA